MRLTRRLNCELRFLLQHYSMPARNDFLLPCFDLCLSTRRHRLHDTVRKLFHLVKYSKHLSYLAGLIAYLRVRNVR